MPSACNSSTRIDMNEGGGGGSMAVTPQNEPWGAGDVDGFLNMLNPQQIDAVMGATSGAAAAWLSDLTEAQRDGVVEYTGDYFDDINAALRGTQPKFPHNYDPTTAIETVTEALEKGVIPRPVVLHRGSGPELLGGASTVEEVRAMIGQVVLDHGFGSSTTRRVFAENTTLGSNSKKTKVIYHIKTPAGTGIGGFIAPISHYGKTESEFLFQRESMFKVVRGYEDGGQVHCDLEYAGCGL